MHLGMIQFPERLHLREKGSGHGTKALRVAADGHRGSSERRGRHVRHAERARSSQHEQQDEAALRTVQIMIKSPNGSDKDFCLTMPLDDTRVRDVKRLLHEQHPEQIPQFPLLPRPRR